jgi:hypothetical protein
MAVPPSAKVVPPRRAGGLVPGPSTWGAARRGRCPRRLNRSPDAGRAKRRGRSPTALTIRPVTAAQQKASKHPSLCGGGRGCKFDDRVRRSRATSADSLSAHSETVAAGATMPVRQRRQVCVSRREPARAWLLHAWSGHAGVATAALKYGLSSPGSPVLLLRVVLASIALSRSRVGVVLVLGLARTRSLVGGLWIGG